MTNDALTTALACAAEVGPGRFGTIGDISCDIEVSGFARPRVSLFDITLLL